MALAAVEVNATATYPAAEFLVLMDLGLSIPAGSLGSPHVANTTHSSLVRPEKSQAKKANTVTLLLQLSKTKHLFNFYMLFISDKGGTVGDFAVIIVCDEVEK